MYLNICLIHNDMHSFIQLLSNVSCCLVYSNTDIVMYLLYTTSFVILEEVKNFKSLQSYRYFIAGWVIEHR